MHRDSGIDLGEMKEVVLGTSTKLLQAQEKKRKCNKNLLKAKKELERISQTPGANKTLILFMLKEVERLEMERDDVEKEVVKRLFDFKAASKGQEKKIKEQVP